MKPKRLALLTAISLLTLGGLYLGFFQATPDNVDSAPLLQKPQALLDLGRAPTGADAAHSSIPANGSTGAVDSSPPDTADEAFPVGAPSQASAAPATPETHALSAEPQTSGTALTPAPVMTEREDTPAPPPLGIRLAPDVRLPLAAMPHNWNLNPVKQKALQNIIDGYYQAVAATATAPTGGLAANSLAPQESAIGEIPITPGNSSSSDVDAPPSDHGSTPDLTVIEENGEETRIIQNSPEVEAARKHADIIFKTIFGDAAYNRMTMETLLESRLPHHVPEQ